MRLSLLLAWRNLWRQPRRTWLTVAAMVFSNVLLVFMICLQFGMYQVMIENTLRIFTGHLQVQAVGYNETPRMYKTVEEVEQLAQQMRAAIDSESVAARASGFALVSSEQRSYGALVQGVQPEFEPLVSSLPGLVKSGTYLQPGNAAEVVLGQSLAKNLQVEVGDELTILGSAMDGSFAADIVKIGGIFATGMMEVDRNFVQMSLPRFQAVFNMPGQGHSIVVLGDDFYRLGQMQQQLAPVLAGRKDDVLLDWDQLLPGLQQAITADMASAWFMYAVLIVLVAFSVLNTQLMSVMERTREFGIVLSLGLRPGKLARLVVLETVLMAGLGFIIGVALGGLWVLYVNQQGFTLPGMEQAMARFNLPGRVYPSVDPFSICLGPMVVFTCSVLAALYPALRLQFLHPIAAMRSA